MRRLIPVEIENSRSSQRRKSSKSSRKLSVEESTSRDANRIFFFELCSRKKKLKIFFREKNRRSNRDFSGKLRKSSNCQTRRIFLFLKLFFYFSRFEILKRRLKEKNFEIIFREKSFELFVHREFVESLTKIRVKRKLNDRRAETKENRGEKRNFLKFYVSLEKSDENLETSDDREDSARPFNLETDQINELSRISDEAPAENEKFLGKILKKNFSKRKEKKNVFLRKISLRFGRAIVRLPCSEFSRGFVRFRFDRRARRKSF